MAETGYNEVYDSQGNLVESAPFVISDDQLLVRDLTKESNEYHTLALQALRNWGSLTLPQKDKVLKFLLGFYLVAGQQLGYFKIDG